MLCMNVVYNYCWVQFNSVVQSHPALCDTMNCSMASCLSPTPGVHSNSCLSSRWCHPAISSSVIPFSFCLQSFPASRSFVKWVSSSHQLAKVLEFSASKSVLPMNTQDWCYPLGWTGWTSLQSKGLSRAFSNTIVQKHQLLDLSFLYSPTLTSIHDHWKNHSLD